MLGRLGRLLLVIAVLLAQQTALAHQYWHAAKATVSADAKQAPKGDRLCDLHDLLGTVLGVASAMTAAPAFLALGEPDFTAWAAAVREAALLAHHSRDPPSSS
jgi:hypothetical protein